MVKGRGGGEDEEQLLGRGFLLADKKPLAAAGPLASELFQPGQDTKDMIHDMLRILVVGAGGLGCELRELIITRTPLSSTPFCGRGREKQRGAESSHRCFCLDLLASARHCRVKKSPDHDSSPLPCHLSSQGPDHDGISQPRRH